MRLSVASLRRVVKGDLAIQFVPQQLTSYGGLELIRRYVQRIGLATRLRQAFTGLRSDYGSARLGLMLLALLFVGGRRLDHLRHVADDPLVHRFCGLARLPTAWTVAHWLKQFTQQTLAPLVALNQTLVTEAIARLDLPRLTIDVDGSVIRTGMKVGWAFRGYSPHHRKDPSYYPLLAHLAQTGHILRLKNRPGNVHDSKQAVAFLREVIDDLRAQFGRRVALEFRMDAAFFQRGIFPLLTARGCHYAIKVGYWSWLPLKRLAAECRHWEPVAPGVTGHETTLVVPPWNLPLRVMLFRKHVGHRTRKNFQLDLFTPDDGHYEYSAVATNMPLGLAALWAFACGRGAQEKTFAELKGEFALDVVPTNHYAANSAWQQLSVLAYNLMRNFQLDTLAEPKPRSRKRTDAFLFRSMRTLRFLFVARAGRLTRIDGCNVLRLAHNPATQALYDRITHALVARSGPPAASMILLWYNFPMAGRQQSRHSDDPAAQHRAVCDARGCPKRRRAQ